MGDARYSPSVKVDHARLVRSITALLQQAILENDPNKVNQAWNLFKTNLVPLGDFGGALGVSPPYPGDTDQVIIVAPVAPAATYVQAVQVGTILAIPLDLPPGPFPVSNDILPSAVPYQEQYPPLWQAALSPIAGGMDNSVTGREVSTPGKSPPFSGRCYFNIRIAELGVEGQTQATMRFQWFAPH